MMQMLRLQWLASRWLLIPLVLICVGLPQAVLRMSLYETHGAVGGAGAALPAVLLASLQSLSTLFPYVAAVTGTLVALTAWNWDHRAGHVYALALPVSRARYALLKLWAGAVLLLVPVIALWIGALVATATLPIPDGLHAYPGALGARFLFAALLVYAGVFALAAGTVRTTLILLVAWLLFFIGGSIVVPHLESRFVIDLMTPPEMIAHAVRTWAGPFRVFGGSWLLIDV
jgi:ABC-type transport system involved in multi-copper enzyme maturation permease subunit